MIPTVVIRADNALAVPLLTEYVRALLGEVDTAENPDLLRQRAREIADVTARFVEWAESHPQYVRLDRTLTPADPGSAVHEARRRLRERVAAHERDVKELRVLVDSVRRELLQMRDERDALRAEVQHLKPVQYATMTQTPR